MPLTRVLWTLVLALTFGCAGEKPVDPDLVNTGDTEGAEGVVGLENSPTNNNDNSATKVKGASESDSTESTDLQGNAQTEGVGNKNEVPLAQLDPFNDDWNDVNAAASKVVLTPVGWETHSSPELGARLIDGAI